MDLQRVYRLANESLFKLHSDHEKKNEKP